MGLPEGKKGFPKGKKPRVSFPLGYVPNHAKRSKPSEISALENFKYFWLGFIADSLSVAADLGRPMLDQTRLSGTFDFILEWIPEVQGPLPPGADIQPDPSGPDFQEALREQLGLKLESQKGPVDILVVDHVEHPSEN
jgi:uncharacterized protein (TIGR03435 family)